MPDKYRKTTRLSLAIITAVLLISLYICPSKAIANTAPNTDTTISKADHEALITTAKDYFIDTTNKILWITAVIVTITLAMAGLLFPYVMEKRRDTINKSLLEKLETQLQSYSKDQTDKAVEKSEESLRTGLQAVQNVFDHLENKLTDDIKSKTTELSNRIYIEQGERYFDSARDLFGNNEFVYAFRDSLCGLNAFVSGNDFDSASDSLDSSKAGVQSAYYQGDETLTKDSYLRIVELFDTLKASLACTDHYDRFSTRLNEIKKWIDNLGTQIPPDKPTQPTQQTPDDTNQTE